MGCSTRYVHSEGTVGVRAVFMFVVRDAVTSAFKKDGEEKAAERDSHCDVREPTRTAPNTKATRKLDTHSVCSWACRVRRRVHRCISFRHPACEKQQASSSLSRHHRTSIPSTVCNRNSRCAIRNMRILLLQQLVDSKRWSTNYLSFHSLFFSHLLHSY